VSDVASLPARPSTLATGTTPAQTVGPFFALGLAWEGARFVVPEGTPRAFRIHGGVYDGAGAPVPDAVVETWQADASGRFEHPDDARGAVEWDDFRGFGRAETDEEGHWFIHTLKPGRVPDRDGVAQQAPHIDMSVFARGLLLRLVTRIYFADEEEANAEDLLLAAVADVRSTRPLLAVPDQGGYRFDIHLQGEHESVFLEL
jgi:protocatechuate 3,4-dioxygenase, alpha subunit